MAILRSVLTPGVLGIIVLGAGIVATCPRACGGEPADELPREIKARASAKSRNWIGARSAPLCQRESPRGDKAPRSDANTHPDSSFENRSSIRDLTAARQLIVVKTADWSAVPATMELFERSKAGHWERHAGPVPAAIGRNGLRWGLGLHGSATVRVAVKREGDDCAPAGVFSLDQVFGSAPVEAARFLKMPYVRTAPDLEGVDDPASRYYNRLVRRGSIARPDWRSSEKMSGAGGQYRWGVVVRHNWDQRPGFGSCIFLHLWAGPGIGTSGCTAFAPETMETLLHWLDRSAHPLLVQLPAGEYRARRVAWGLP